MSKMSIRFYNDHEVRAVWDDNDPRWCTIDGKSKKKAYAFWESNLIADDDIGTTKALQQIHAYIFGGLYDFAGKIRNKTISKGDFTFCLAQYLQGSLKEIDGMPEDTFDKIYDRDVFMKGIDYSYYYEEE